MKLSWEIPMLSPKPLNENQIMKKQTEIYVDLITLFERNTRAKNRCFVYPYQQVALLKLLKENVYGK